MAVMAPFSTSQRDEVRPDPDADDRSLGRGFAADHRYDLVVAGASGPEGLRQLTSFLGALPSALPAAVVVVLHRPVDAKSHLREILGRASPLPVRIAAEREPFERGVCYIGEPARHLAVGPRARAELQLDHLFRNRTVDLLFKSAAKYMGPRTIGIVFAGSLSDGAQGLRKIAEAGGVALIQKAAGATHWGMPEHALEAVPNAEVFASPRAVADRVALLVGAAPAPGGSAR